jgi:GH35 family endo-1,4-beta-xylanase
MRERARPRPNARTAVADAGVGGPGAPRPRLAAPLVWTVLLVFLLGLALPTAASAGSASPPRGFVGLQGWTQPGAEGFARLGRGEVRVWRTNMTWYAVERGDGSYDWRRMDALYERAAAAGVRIMPVLVGSPKWVAEKPQWPPTTRAHRLDFRRFTAAAVKRYGPAGTFWQGKPYSSWLRSYWWQVWNEPNHRSWWTDRRPNAAEYAKLLIEVSGTAKRANPDVKIVSAGLPQLNLTKRCAQLCIYKFLGDMLEVRGTGRALDAVAVHAYSRYTKDILTRMGYARDAMRRFSDARDKHLWVTELGWSTNGEHAYFPTVTPRQQAEKLEVAYRMLIDTRRRYKLAGAVWFSHSDPYRSSDWQRNTGVFDWRGAPKPAWGALVEVTGGRR